MVKLLNFHDYHVVVPKKGEKTWLVELPEGDVEVDVEIRSVEETQLQGIGETGEGITLGSGKLVSYAGRLRGFRAVEICTTSSFAYRATVRGITDGNIDPVPAGVSVQVTAYDAMRLAVRAELVKQLGEAGYFAADVDPDELYEDALKGDFEFDQDEDDFVSRSYEDMLEDNFADDPRKNERQSGEPPEKGEPPKSEAQPPAEERSDPSAQPTSS